MTQSACSAATPASTRIHPSTAINHPMRMYGVISFFNENIVVYMYAFPIERFSDSLLSLCMFHLLTLLVHTKNLGASTEERISLVRSTWYHHRVFLLRVRFFCVCVFDFVSACLILCLRVCAQYETLPVSLPRSLSVCVRPEYETHSRTPVPLPSFHTDSIPNVINEQQNISAYINRQLSFYFHSLCPTAILQNQPKNLATTASHHPTPSSTLTIHTTNSKKNPMRYNVP